MALFKAQSLNLTHKFVFIVSQQNAVATGDTLAGNIMSVFGDNIAKDKLKYDMPVEEIIAAEPDLVFIAKDIDKTKLSEQIVALLAKDGVKIIEIDYSYFEKPTCRLSVIVDVVTAEFSPPVETQTTESSNVSE